MAPCAGAVSSLFSALSHPSFALKRWLVLISTFIYFLFFLALTIGAFCMKKYMKTREEIEWSEKIGTEPPERSLPDKLIIIAILLFFALLALFSLCGFIGSLRNSFKLTAIYVAELLFEHLSFLVITLMEHQWSFLLFQIVPAFSTIIALYYLRDLYLIRREERRKGEDT